MPHALRFLLATDSQALAFVLGVAYRAISGYLIRKAGLTRATGDTGAVTFVQRFGSALNLNVHFHMLFLDGAYAVHGGDPPVFRRVPEPGAKDLQEILERIAGRIGSALERRGLVERDIEKAWLALVIARILSHLERTASDSELPQLPLGARAPPSQPKLL